jgi:hypothetical protein
MKIKEGIVKMLMGVQLNNLQKLEREISGIRMASEINNYKAHEIGFCINPNKWINKNKILSVN